MVSEWRALLVRHFFLSRPSTSVGGCLRLNRTVNRERPFFLLEGSTGRSEEQLLGGRRVTGSVEKTELPQQ